MALTLSDFAGWETGEVSSGGHTTSGTVSVVTSPVYGSGVYAFRCNPTTTGTGYVQMGGFTASGAANTSLGAQMVGVAFKFRYATKPAANYERIASGHTNAAGPKWIFVLNSSGNIELRTTGGTLVTTSATALSADTWYDLRIEAESASATAEIRLWIDGTLEINESTYNSSTTAHGYVRLGKTANTNGQSVDYYYDDVVLYSGLNDGEAGEVAAGAAMTIRMANANGDGNYTAWTGDYTAVDETPPSTADYVNIAANTAGAETFTLENCSAIGLGGSDTIDAVRFIASFAEDASGTSLVNVMCRNGSTDVHATAVDATTSATYYNILRTTDPNGGGAWTQSGFNSSEVGANNANDAYTAGIRMYWAGAEVLYTPGAGGVGPIIGGRLLTGLINGGRLVA